MDEINRQLQELKLQEQELQQQELLLRKQKLLLQKKQHEEEIKRIEAQLNNQEQNVCSAPNTAGSTDINVLTQLLMQQQQRIEQLERVAPAPRVRRTIPKVPPSQRTARQRQRTREISPSGSPEPVAIPELLRSVIAPPKSIPLPVKPLPTPAQERQEHIIIDFSDDNEMHDKMYSELVEEWTVDDEEKRRINQLMYGELSQADQDKINSDDQLYNQYISGSYTPDSYTRTTNTDHHSAMAEHMRRRMKGTRWRQSESETNNLAAAQQNLHKRLWERNDSSPESSDDEVVFLPRSPVDAMTDATRTERAANLIFRRNHAE